MLSKKCKSSAINPFCIHSWKRRINSQHFVHISVAINMYFKLIVVKQEICLLMLSLFVREGIHWKKNCILVLVYIMW